MPMFDNPKNELNRLQEELLAEEDTKWEDELGDLDALLADYQEDRTMPAREPYKQGKDLQKNATILTEEEDDEDDELEEEEEKPAKSLKFRKPAKAEKPAKVEKPVKEKASDEKGVVGLIIAACLETVAIIGLLAWWFFCLR